ncbi:glycosyltransferase family 4 protein [Microbacterium cremeum]|uniref:glycosyltransferase family 4 protein n=1 Tax=Microbacterium cremeum TaxID=2782169 RepID=UPI001888594F|nr:glycosyltransferase family 4 protein [Microbacterium cremeum]
MSAPAPVVWFVVPGGFDDPGRVSGGNVYDRRVSAELRTLGWDVRIEEVAADAPDGDPLEHLPDGALVLVDGLIAIGSPAAIEAASVRLRVVVIAHMLADAFPDPDPAAIEGERRALPRAHRVIAASAWLRDELTRRGLVAPERLVVAAPGSDQAPLATGTTTGGSLLCVGVVAAHKGHDTLVEALARLGDVPAWTCTFAGSVSTDPGFATRVARAASAAGLSPQISWAGVLSPRELDGAYANADLLVAPSRTETYGIAIGDALGRGIPVIASSVGGIPEATQPPEAALLVPPGDPAALGDALRRWLEDPRLRASMSAAARHAAPARRRWSDTARAVHSALEALS